MGTSTDAYICYGINVGDTEVPWDDPNRYDDGIHTWWLEVTGFDPENKPPWDDEGNWLMELSKEERDQLYEAWRAEKAQWVMNHPLPVELVNTCSYSCPEYILAVPGSVVKADRGYPTLFRPKDLLRQDACFYNSSLKESWLRFVIDHGFEQFLSNEGWYLSSFWGV